MKTNIYDYWYQICPHCRSKKVKPVSLRAMRDSSYNGDTVQANRTGFLCGNCGRYHIDSESKYAYDRKEMKRDIKKLQRFLYGEQK